MTEKPTSPTRLVKRQPRAKPSTQQTLISPETWGLRQQLLQRYGGHCVCPCGCQENNLRNLQLDHVNGAGKEDRKQRRGNTLYKELLAQPLDPSFKPLCANCHWQKTLFGACNGGSQYGGSVDEIPVETTTFAPELEPVMREEETRGQLTGGSEPDRFPQRHSTQTTSANGVPVREPIEMPPLPGGFWSRFRRAR